MNTQLTTTYAAQNVAITSDERDEQLAPYLVDDLGDTPAIYVGTYHKYNNGSIAGAWLDLTQFDSYDEFIEICRLLHNDENDPEFMYQDFQGFPRVWYDESCIHEHFDDIIEYAKLDDDDKQLVDEYSEWSGDYNIAKAKDAFVGVYESEEDFAEQMVRDCYDIDNVMGKLSYYFDYSKFARDLFMCDYYYSSNGYVFSCY